MSDLSGIVKAYDIRGVVPDELGPDVARDVGAAFAVFSGAADGGSVVTAHDMRTSSPELAAAFADGVTGQGADVVEAGLASTDLLYFASGFLDMPGAMFTASHNPARYNGIKLCLAGARPVGQDSGLADVRKLAEDGPTPRAGGRRGRVTGRDLLAEYVTYLHELVDLSGIRPLTVVVDAGNGMGGLTVPRVFEGLPIRLVPLYFDLDGNFPNHEANPIEPENLVDLQKAVREHRADVGLAFDGDADRCFVVDEKAQVVNPSVLTALIATQELAREPGATVIHNLITSHAVPEIVREHGGVPVRTRVGHSFIKGEMARTGAIFGGEHSGHFYFREFFRADSGMLAALHTLAALGGQPDPLSRLLAHFARYRQSGEINSTVDDQDRKLAEVERELGAEDGAESDRLDGLTVTFADGAWFNLRPSNTEPLLRLNVEAADEKRLTELRDRVLGIVREDAS